MIADFINDVSGTIRGTFFNGDWVAILIAFGSVLIAAIMMKKNTQIGSMTLLALVLFALGGFLRGFFRGPDPAAGAEGGRAVSQLEGSVSSFMNMSAGNLLAYFIAFMVLIFVIHWARTILSRTSGGGGH
jgi:hypothetical protein